MLRNKLFVVLYIDNRSFVVVLSDFSVLVQPQLVLQQSHKLYLPSCYDRKTTIALPL